MLFGTRGKIAILGHLFLNKDGQTKTLIGTDNIFFQVS